ncbi:MAG TPA: TolC family protein [Thermoanaerobaculia bacterium]|nr:TolC family protein [Thermoanaerobaculia bacterium]
MTRFRQLGLLAALASAGLAMPAAGEPPAGSPLSLSDAIAIARQASPAAAAAHARARSSEDQSRAASLFWAPDLAIDSVWDRTEVPARAFAQKLNRGEFTADDFALDHLNSPGFDANLETTFGLRLPLDLFGAGRSGKAAAQAAARADASRADAVDADVDLETIRAYFGVREADRTATAAAASLDAARELERSVTARKESGSALEADVLRVRTRRRQREVETARARTQVELARSRLRVHLGWGGDAPVVLSSEPDAEPPHVPLEEWLARAAAGNPDLAAATAAAAVPAAMERRERAAGRPALQLFGGWQDDRNSLSHGQGSATVELRFHWAVWDPARSARNAAAADAARAARESRRGAADAVRLDVEARWRDLDVARLEAQAAADGRREAAEVYRVSRERWEAGRAALVDLLDAESAAAAAEADEARASIRVALAQAVLERAAGKK